MHGVSAAGGGEDEDGKHALLPDGQLRSEKSGKEVVRGVLEEGFTWTSSTLLGD